MTQQIEHSHHFDIHASVIFQLGEGLISDEIQALVELIKNSYDADADYAKITIETDSTNTIEGSYYPTAKGYICIDDNGCGMDTDTIKRGWLTISNSVKRDMKAAHKTTEKGRTPLGDKGLGRLGVQRLGYNVEIFTKPKNSNVAYHVAFSWKDFIDAKTLGNVPVYFDEIKLDWEKGTRLLISDIKEPQSWKDKDSVGALEDQLSEMISPYKELQDFKVIARINGAKLELAEITEQILNAAQLRYLIHFDGNKFYVKGLARIGYLRPENARELSNFKILVEDDQGERFFNFICSKSKAKSINLKRSEEQSWLLEYSYLNSVFDIDGLELTDGKLANPGPFYGEVDSFDLGRSGYRKQSVFNSITSYRNYLKKLSGIRVYRDGFGIRLNRDWLGLGRQEVEGGSWYGLKLLNTTGYIALSAKENSLLEETTDREGFKVNPYYSNFYKLLDVFKRFSADSQEFLRRTWLEYRNEYDKAVAHVKTEITPEALTKEIKDSAAKAKDLQQPLAELRESLDKTSQEAQNAVESAQRNDDQAKKNKLSMIIDKTAELQRNIDSARNYLTQLDNYLIEISKIESKGTVLINQINQLRQQLEQFYDTISLGLTAEALSHEIKNVADGLAERTLSIKHYITQKYSNDVKVYIFMEHIESAVSALRKQLSHMDPALRYVRETKEPINLLDFFNEIKEYYRERFERNGINVDIRGEEASSFPVRLNKGKFTQIVDNLFLNSEYWLREDLRLNNISEGRISIDFKKPFLRVSDNGRGIDPAIEPILFEPFVTTKGKGKGRGLGLFIVRQLLDSDGCSISLLPDRNQNGRRYIFEIDLAGGFNGNH